MQALLLTLGAMAGVASAWSYPDCEPDNCYRNLIDTRYTAVIGPFCVDYLAPTATASPSVPTDYSNCASPAELSSACSCVAYTYTHTPSASSVPPSTTLSSVFTTSSSAVATSTAAGTVVSSSYVSSPTSTNSSVATSEHSQQLTTSTVYKTTTYTISSCAPTVTNCPYGHVTTDIISLYVTVCPVTESTPAHLTIAAANVGTTSKVVGTIGSKTTSASGLQVTGAAGRVNAAFEMAAAAAGLIGAALL